MKKALIVTSCLLALSSCKNEPKIDLSESIFNNNMIHYLGRNNITSEGVNFAMTCSGFELKIKVNDETNKLEANLDSYCDTGGQSQYAYVYIDGVEPNNKLEINSSITSYTLASNLSIGEHYIRFIKLNEGVYSNITLKDLTLDGISWLRWDKTYEKRIEFYGDSITAGYGNENVIPSNFSFETQNGAYTYAYVCALELGYEPSFCAESGMSLYMNAWNNPIHFEDIYDTYDCKNKFDVANYKVDIAVIALGTNDNTVLSTYDAKKQESEIEYIFTKYKELASKIKTYNPDCQIFFIYNLMLKQSAYIDTAILGTCNYINSLYGENSAYCLEFAPNNQGGAGHPIKEAHLKDGKILADFIRNPYN